MSEEQLKAFMDAVKADAGLQEKLKAAGDADAVVAIAKAAGFVISAEELTAQQVTGVDAEAVIDAEAATEVTEEELVGVAGGTGTWTLAVLCF